MRRAAGRRLSENDNKRRRANEPIAKNTACCELVGKTNIVRRGCRCASAGGRMAVSGETPATPISTTTQGVVQSFTTAPRGEVDGAVLDNGTRLHWPPHMQDRFRNLLLQGDQVRASGRSERGPAGETHLEVQSVTDLRTNLTAENPDFAAGPPAPPRGPMGPAGRRGRLSRRVRAPSPSG